MQTYGIFTLLSPDDESVFAYTKDYQSERVIVALNFTDSTVDYDGLPDAGDMDDSVGNYGDEVPSITEGMVSLRPWEAVVYSTRV